MPKVVSTGEALLLDSKFAGDEPFMLAHNLDGVSVVVDKNRVKGGRFAVGISPRTRCCWTTACSISISRMASTSCSSIPARPSAPRPCCRAERCASRRKTCAAPAIFSSPSATAVSNEELIERIRKYNSTAEIIECTHGPIHLENVFTREREPLDFLKDKWVGAISAIAVPEAFEGSLEKLGARVEIRRRFADHYRFSRKDVEKFMQRCVERDMQLIVTTEKDAVRFPRPAIHRRAGLFSAHRGGDPQRP